MRLIFICISTRAYPYDLLKIGIIFMLKNFVSFNVTFIALHIDAMTPVQTRLT